MGSNDVGPSTDKGWAEGLQMVVNARKVPARRRQTRAHVPIPVRARIVWERDGEQVIDTRVTAWTYDLVLVEVLDPRSKVRGAWLIPKDVRRITPPAGTG